MPRRSAKIITCTLRHLHRDFVRDFKTISGILGSDEDRKISLYADDMLLFLSHPSSSIPALKEWTSTLKPCYKSRLRVSLDG